MSAASDLKNILGKISDCGEDVIGDAIVPSINKITAAYMTRIWELGKDHQGNALRYSQMYQAYRVKQGVGNTGGRKAFRLDGHFFEAFGWKKEGDDYILGWVLRGDTHPTANVSYGELAEFLEKQIGKEGQIFPLSPKEEKFLDEEIDRELDRVLEQCFAEI